MNIEATSPPANGGADGSPTAVIELGRSPFARAIAGVSRLASSSREHGKVAGRWPRLTGRSAAVARLEDSIARVAQFDCPVLVTGETGRGKDEIARAIHAAGPRASKPFISVNCGGLVATLAESQLFGHEKGAFTGAVGPSLGAFRAADGGVVFLDEIGEMPTELQPKLLQVLQRLEVMPVGSTRGHHVDVQVIAATNRDLDAAVADGAFREDLFYRLNTVHLTVPPLRARKEDIPRFVSHFSAHFAGKYDRPQWWPSPDVLSRLVEHAWPGNVRQLAQFVQRIYVFEDRAEEVLRKLFEESGGDGLPAEIPNGGTLPPAASEPALAAGPRSMTAVANEPTLPVFNLEELRWMAVRQCLAATGGHRGRAAAMLGVSLNTMTRLVAEACPELAAAVKSGRKRSVKPR